MYNVMNNNNIAFWLRQGSHDRLFGMVEITADLQNPGHLTTDITSWAIDYIYIERKGISPIHTLYTLAKIAMRTVCWAPSWIDL